MLEELITTARRVYCLYRVSTLGQVEKDDIPMQKEACREFVRQHPGWEIVREFSEKGVSRFKVSAKDRDAIQEIQWDALQTGTVYIKHQVTDTIDNYKSVSFSLA